MNVLEVIENTKKEIAEMSSDQIASTLEEIGEAAGKTGSVDDALGGLLFIEAAKRLRSANAGKALDQIAGLLTIRCGTFIKSDVESIQVAIGNLGDPISQQGGA